MLDIRLIREKPDEVAAKSRQKGYDVNIDKLLQLDDNRRLLVAEIERVRQERNQLADKIKAGQPDDQSLQQGKKLKGSLGQLEAQLKPLEAEFYNLLKAVPNLPAED